MPVPLLVAAARMLAVCVPCQLLLWAVPGEGSLHRLTSSAAVTQSPGSEGSGSAKLPSLAVTSASEELGSARSPTTWVTPQPMKS